MIERKCLKCGTWNGDEKFCKSCSATIAPDEIFKEELLRREEEQAKIPKARLEVILTRAKESKYLLARLFFYMVYSVGFFVALVAAFMAYMIAMTSG